MKRMLLYLVFGIVIDLLITTYTRCVAGGYAGLASLFAGIVTLASYWILGKFIKRWDNRLILAYAIGTAIGTLIGMKL